ncbi:MAG: hypothetical protein JST43_02455 [Bacteroidetes bacterium]|nr:hypothetical protein [Bacteroidota bacterium]MBS1541162.1 hypothetical protein [Bacteroidota bacterium]
MLKNAGILFTSFILLAGAMLSDHFEQRSFSVSSLSRQVESRLAATTKLLKQEASHIESDPDLRWSSLKFPFFLFENDTIKMWSQTDVPIRLSDVRGNFEWKLAQSITSDFLLFKKYITPNRFLVGVIVLRKGYSLENRYLAAEWNRNIFPADGIAVKAEPKGENPSVMVEGIRLRLQIPDVMHPENLFSVWLAVGSIVFLLLFLYRSVRYFHKIEKHTEGFLILSGVLVLLRISMVTFSFPSRWIKSDFFDPRYFASSSFNASAGDFLLNSVVVTVACAYLFFNIDRIKIPLFSYQTSWRESLLAVVVVAAAYFAFLFPNLFIEAIFHDSSLSFDITSITPFTLLQLAVVVAFALGCLSSFFVVSVCIQFVKRLVAQKYFIIITLSGAFIFLCYFIISQLNYWPTFLIGSVYFLILLFTSGIEPAEDGAYSSFPVLLLIIFFYSVQATWVTVRFSEERKLKLMLRAANNLISNDVLAEYLLSKQIPQIARDSTGYFKKNNPILYSQERQRMTKLLSNEYLDRYKISIDLFQADGLPVDGLNTDDFATALKKIEGQSNSTAYAGIYLIRRRNAEVLRHYTAVVPVKRNNIVQGYALVHLYLTKAFSDRVYPELTLDSRFARSIRNNDYSYAFYNQTGLLDQFGEMNFLRDVDPDRLFDGELYSKGKAVGGYLFAGAEDETNLAVVVAAKQARFFLVAANFSFLFVIGVALSFTFFIFHFLKRTLSRSSVNYSTRIRFFAYLSFGLPLLAVSIISLRMISQSNESEQEKEINNKGIYFTERLSLFFDSSSDSAKQMQETKWKELVSPAEMDVNLYDAEGHLVKTNQPSLFQNQLTMPLIDRLAFETIAGQRYMTFELKHRIGTLEYNSRFFAIHNNRHKLAGILELPFFEPTAGNLKVNLLANILITFTIVFILFSLATESSVRRLIAPLQFITKKLNETKLTGNKPIEWKPHDEIGRLITEYNRMIENLAASRNELARTQKESAWREIAQQVAHEIKNPLTPMKLTLQRLEQMETEDAYTKERIGPSLKTLLTQLNVLNEIANSFSAFATMPQPVMSKVNLTKVLSDIATLFQNHSMGMVLYQNGTETFYVWSDEPLLTRSISNIVLNALQSGDRGKPVRVEIFLTTDSEGVVISVKDNGTGISPDMVDKIFLPHFTTKKSGSGLGLAIAKRGIEQMEGAIWYNTSTDGTTFFIRLKRA